MDQPLEGIGFGGKWSIPPLDDRLDTHKPPAGGALEGVHGAGASNRRGKRLSPVVGIEIAIERVALPPRECIELRCSRFVVARAFAARIESLFNHGPSLRA